MKQKRSFCLLCIMAFVGLNQLTAQEHWVNDDFTKENFSNSVLTSKDYIQTIEKIASLPAQLHVETYYANIEPSTPGLIRVRAEADGGYIKIAVPSSAEFSTILSAKGKADAPRTAKVYRDGELIGTIGNLYTGNLIPFVDEYKTLSEVTYTIMSGCDSPITVSQIKIVKNGEGIPSTRPTLTINEENNTPLVNGLRMSGVINDPTCPMATIGLNIMLKSVDQIEKLTLIAKSSNEQVVAEKNIKITGTGNLRNIKIAAHGVGYTDILLTVSNGEESSSLTLAYAASEEASDPTNTYFHTGIADASTAIPIGKNYMIVADDETNDLRLFHRYQSGLPITQFNLQSQFNATEETDIEASVRGIEYPNRIYWVGSLGNSKSGGSKPFRNRIFATDLVDNEAEINLTYANHFELLREMIINWGDKQGWDFTASASVANKMIPKRIDGFNVEGMEFAPDRSTAWFGLRAPLVPAPGEELTEKNRRMALIVQIPNFEKSMNDGTMQEAIIGEPILLDLGGRSIRSLERLSNGQYLIVTGMYDDQKKPALYIWNGTSSDQPTLLHCELLANGESHPEGAIEVESSDIRIQIQLISDNGTVDYYNDGKEAKTLAEGWKKYRSDVVSIDLLPLANQEKEMTTEFLKVLSNDGTITVAGNVATQTTLIISSIEGVIVNKRTITGTFNTRIEIPKEGIYIVQVGDSRCKTIVCSPLR